MKHSARVSPVLSPIGIAAAALLTVAAALAAAGLPAGDVGPTYAIRGCRIVPVTGPPVDKGVIVIRDGLIESLGPADKVKVPADAEVVEADGLIAYPGLVSAMSNLFIEPPAAVRGEAALEAEIPFPAGQAAPAEDRYFAAFMSSTTSNPRKRRSKPSTKPASPPRSSLPTRGIFQGQQPRAQPQRRAHRGRWSSATAPPCTSTSRPSGAATPRA
ncbi:MAG: hypothetical protein MZV64_11745 [Ignavibacteriales bacterium]|nr:hypothetical protein [Ignavibacteriales bacterium]